MRFIYRVFLFSVLSTSFLGHAAFSQANTSSFSRNTIYAEGATQGSPYSINFDHIFHIGENVSYAYRAGFSVENEKISVPVGISLLTGQYDHHFELSATVIPYLYLKEYKDDPLNLIGYIIPAVGYRYQRPEGGLFFRVSAGPAIFYDPPSDNFFHVHPKTFAYGSLGLGISF